MPEPTEREADWLALEGCDMGDFRPGAVAPHDLAGYERIPRCEVAPGSYSIRRTAATSEVSTPVEAQFGEERYLVRISGFRRGKLFAPDEIGALIACHGIPGNDGLGNGLLESLLIDRKYGLSHALEAPVVGFAPPFLESEWPAFRESYPKRVEAMVRRLEEMEPIYGGPLVRRRNGVCTLWCRETPLSLFLHACARDAKGMREEMVRFTGRDAPPIEPATSEDRAALAKFWALIHTRHARVVEFQAQALRAALGPGTKIVGNAHELPPVDLEIFGRAYDAPGLAVRPTLLTDEVFLRHYVGYFTQMFRDLSGRPPIVSVRVNLLAAGCRFLPSADLIRLWYDQAVRHGAGGFYLWPRDYPSDVSRDPYDGPIPGNPDPSTFPKVRWETSLETLGKLAARRRFRVPSAEVAILIPNEAALLYRREWRRLYAAFSACAEARIHTRFLSDRAIGGGGVPSDVRLVIAPMLEFVSPGLREALEGFTRSGGALLVSDLRCWDAEGRTSPPLQGAEETGPGPFEIFPLEHPASLDALLRVAETLKKKLTQRRIDAHSWVFDVSSRSLPRAAGTALRSGDPGIGFEHWMYEHSSDWIFPYVGREAQSP